MTDNSGHHLVELYGQVISQCATQDQVDDLLQHKPYVRRPPDPATQTELLEQVRSTPFTHAVIFKADIARQLFDIPPSAGAEEWGKLGYLLPPPFVPLLDAHLDLLWIIHYRETH